MRRFRPELTIVALLSLLIAAGCGGGSSGSAPVATAGTGGGAAAPTRPPAPTSSPSAVPAGSPSAAPSAVAGGQTVNMTDANQFQPATVTVARGTTITWLNVGTVPHTVTDDPTKAANPSDSVLPAGAQPWDSGMIAGGENFSHTFDTPGQYVYFCIPHESLGMVGRITVSG